MTEENNKLITISPTTNTIGFTTERNEVLTFLQNAMKEGVDYGVIPGTDNKALHQPGAEKLAKFFGLVPEFELLKDKEEFNVGFFYYKYKCKLVHFHTGKFAGEAVRSCNSYEKKYRFKRVAEKWATDEDKKNTHEKKKNKTYNSWDLIVKKTGAELADDMNTIDAMAQKRALVAAVRTATSAAEIFNEDQKEVDPDNARSIYMKKLHVLGAERGFTHDKLSQAAKSKFKVDSMSELTQHQLEELCDVIEIDWEEVGIGNKPKKIGSKTEIKSVPNKEEVVHRDLADAHKEPRVNNEDVKGAFGISDGDIVNLCPECKQPMTNDDIFCSEKCEKAYTKRQVVPSSKQAERVRSKLKDSRAKGEALAKPESI